MRTAALIENGLVSNVIVIADGEQGNADLVALSAIEITGQDVRIGDAFDGSSFTRIKTQEEIEAEEQYAEYLLAKNSLLTKLNLTESEARLLGL